MVTRLEQEQNRGQMKHFDLKFDVLKIALKGQNPYFSKSFFVQNFTSLYKKLMNISKRSKKQISELVLVTYCSYNFILIIYIAIHTEMKKECIITFREKFWGAVICKKTCPTYFWLISVTCQVISTTAALCLYTMFNIRDMWKHIVGVIKDWPNWYGCDLYISHTYIV